VKRKLAKPENQAVGWPNLVRLVCVCVAMASCTSDPRPQSPPEETPAPAIPPSEPVEAVEPQAAAEPELELEPEPEPEPEASPTPKSVEEPVSCGSFAGELPPLKKRVVIEIEAPRPKDRKPSFRARTNLPDGTEIRVDLEGFDIYGSAIPYDYADAVVTAGCIEAGPFSDRGSDLPAGVYQVAFEMPYVLVQPEPIKALLGDGAILKGSLVHRDDLGTAVWAVRKYQLGTVADVRAAQRAGAKRRGEILREARSLRSELSRLIKAGRSMDPLRHSDDLRMLRRCGERMRELQPRAKELRTEADALAHESLRFIGLVEAAVHGDLCVSCLEDARSYCRDAQEGLRSFDREVKTMGR
jgi:hypothetical protein